MGNLNKVMLIGQLAWMPELRVDSYNRMYVNVGLITDKQKHRLNFRDRLAEIVSQYCNKGSNIFIEGSLASRSWNSNNGKVYITEVHVKRLQLLDKKPSKPVPLYVNSPHHVIPNRPKH